MYRDQQIRNERNKTAWMEWKAAKHKKAAANKKKQDEMTKVVLVPSLSLK